MGTRMRESYAGQPVKRVRMESTRGVQMAISYDGELKRKKISAEEAAAKVKSGDWVEYGFGLGQPDLFDRALAEREPKLERVKIRGCLAMRPRAAAEADIRSVGAADSVDNAQTPVCQNWPDRSHQPQGRLQGELHRRCVKLDEPLRLVKGVERCFPVPFAPPSRAMANSHSFRRATSVGNAAAHFPRRSKNIDPSPSRVSPDKLRL